MNVGRMFANAFIRRVAYVVAGVVFAVLASLFGAADAHAQTTCPPTIDDRVLVAGINVTYATAEEALAACRSTGSPARGPLASGWHDRYQRGMCELDEAKKNVRLEWQHIGVWSSCNQHNSGHDASKNQERVGWKWQTLCPPGVPWDPITQTCMEQCADKPQLNNLTFLGDYSMGQKVCNAGCQYSAGSGWCNTVVMDHLTYSWCETMTPTGSTCAAGDTGPTPIPPDKDGDGTSDGNDGAPNNPGDKGGGDDEDGGEACGGPNQPPCPPDGTGKGSGNGNTAGGGGDCSSPPSGSGDALLAMIAFQTWATRCAVEGKPHGGGGGPGGPGPGDPGEGDGEGYDFEGDANATRAFGNATEGQLTSMEGEFGETAFGESTGIGSISTGMFGGGGGCPALSVTVPGVGTWVPPAQFCSVIAALRLLFLAVSTIWALRIVGGE